jgi:protein-disulfide isomerase
MATSPSSQDRRAAQREELRKQRQAELKRQRTVRTVVIAAVTAVALVIVAGLGYLGYRSMQPAGPVASPEGVAEGQAYLSFGAPADSGKPVVELHLDFMCPYCGQFEELNGEDVQSMIENEEATVNIVPRNFLDTLSTTGDYSTRAAGAFVCMSEQDPAAAISFQQLMFANQPAENTAGLTDEQIASYAEEAGASEETLSCLSEGTYQPWVKQVADPYGEETGSGTPYVKVDDTVLEPEQWGEAGVLKQMVDEAAGTASDGGEG